MLTADFNPPIYLNSDREWVMALTNFETFNAIPNITEDNNKFTFGKKVITIPTGSYELTDIAKYVNSQLDSSKHEFVSIMGNNNTLKTIVKSTAELDFSKATSVGKLLGFKKRVLKPNIIYESDYQTNILKVNSLLIECNITTGNYKNGAPGHVIHQFFPSVPPGYKIIESPDHVTYLPVNVSTISNITLKIVDQDGDLVNFRGETVTIGLHLKGVRNGASL